MTGTREFGPRPPRPAAPPREHPRRVAGRVAVALLAIVLLAAAAAVAATRGDRPVPRAEPATDWVAVMRSLDEARSAAFATGDVRRLRAAYAEGCACLRHDTALLRQRGPVRDVRHEVISARPIEQAPGRVTLFVVDRMPPVRAERAWTVDLVLTAGGWRIAAIAPA